jgi:hypothetical protein
MVDCLAVLASRLLDCLFSSVYFTKVMKGEKFEVSAGSMLLQI